MALYSERNGKTRGYSQTDLLAILWGNLQNVLGTHGLLDEMFGYSRSAWSNEDLIDDSGDYADGKYPGTSTTWLNRLLRKKVDFEFRVSWGGRFVDKYDTTNRPSSIGSLEDMFDLLEGIHEVCSLPTFDQSTQQMKSFSQEEGQELLRNAINDDLALFTTPFRMLSNGQIVALDNGAISDLAEEALQLDAAGLKTGEVTDSVQHSVGMFLKRASTLAEKKAAIRELSSALESLRTQVKTNLLSEDENELFSVANNFAIRHQNSKQKTDYDKHIWYDWMFQVNLAAVLTVIKILKSQSSK